MLEIDISKNEDQGSWKLKLIVERLPIFAVNTTRKIGKNYPSFVPPFSNFDGVQSIAPKPPALMHT